MRTSFLLLGLIGFLSGCSEVSLNYQVPNRLQQSGLAATTLNAGGTQTVLANLRLDTQLEFAPAQMAGLTLHFVLSNSQGPIKTLSMPAETFFAEKTLFWDQLPPGEALLRVELQNAEGQQVGVLEHALVLQPEGEDAVHFRLSENGANQGVLSLQPEDDSLEPLSFAFATGLPSTSPASASPSSPNSSNVPQVQGSNTSSPELKLRLVESGQTALQFVWEPPPGVEVAHYQLLLDGEVVATQHPTTNYRATGLSTNTEYTFTVVPVLTDGSSLPAVPLAATTGTGSSGGGGGGGGGGSGSSTPNLPPVIDELTPSRTTAPTGYPVGLSAQASDELNLTDAAYTWSCEACGDASFQTSTGTANTATGQAVVWNAPTTPGTYVLTLSVSDGVNPAVTQTQTIVVEQRLGSVIVEGVYE